MVFPDITHLQFEVLRIIGGSERTGRSIRERLEEAGFKKSLAAFYQLTSRMEDAGLIRGENRRREVRIQTSDCDSCALAGAPPKEKVQTVPERWFKVTSLGQRAYQQTLEFYRQRDLGRLSTEGGLAGE